MRETSVRAKGETPTPKLAVKHFVAIMMVVIAIQGTYLGYTVGVLTTLERRFGISSEKSGLLLSLYDIGHTVAILLVGYFGSKSHLPRITAIGVVLSAISMFLLAMPVFIFGTVDQDGDLLLKHKEQYKEEYRCDPDRDYSAQGEDCRQEHQEHTVAYVFLAFGQVLAGIVAAPFNTLAYVYIDTNIEDKRKSPFLLGLLTSMYAFGPALGFALSSGLTRVYTTLGSAPPHVNVDDDHWIGAWWLGYLICGILYLFAAIPLFFFPKSYKPKHAGAELHPLNRPHLPPSEFSDPEHPSGWEQFKQSLREFPYVLWDLIKNPIFVTMVLAWMFGSYLIGGYQTYLPKYLETQYGRSASMADLYAGIISIGAIAVSTVLGGWILTKWNVAPRKAILCLMLCWIIIVITYMLGMIIGCEQPQIQGNHVSSSMFSPSRHYSRYQHFDAYEAQSGCASDCQCSTVYRFEPVNFDGQNYFSPCHAGCRDYDVFADTWSSCSCAMDGQVDKGLLHGSCDQIYGYLAIMFVGLFAGNIFFMVTMMIVLRSVYDDQKVIALSFASTITNLLGFIPAPVLFGWIIDSACEHWHSRCPEDKGNCVIYDNESFRVKFHVSNAVLQLLAVVFVLACYIVARRTKLPEEEEYMDEQEMEHYEPRQ